MEVKIPIIFGPSMNNGAQRIAAKKIGCTLEEYNEKQSQELRYCLAHKMWLPKEESSRKGLYCHDCFKAKEKRRSDFKHKQERKRAQKSNP